MPDKHFRIGHHRRRQINVLIVKMRKQLEKVKECVSKVTSNDVPEAGSDTGWRAFEHRLCPQTSQPRTSWL